ncbi:hypothetical protein AJ80_05715 [Polytolypa hystricis UAMH7299]|uniref:Nephrocystin 3-like N-terminal domain-containing protein n=1 Tax=Polytolypa hystricis (strain UAMH7299) TaxID=1447883 RepID=A0A2B7Y267_POLH7|nr:hypothetical protein AJ80_05715 [Polytolypa hystricis UAMH7299]
MSDPLSTVASIIAIIDLAANISSACRKYADSVHDAPKLIKRIQETASSLQTLFEELRELGDLRLAKSKCLEKVLAPDGDVKACQTVIIRLEKLVDNYLREVNPHVVGKRRQVCAKVARLKICWMKKAKVHMEEIERYRKTIDEALKMEIVSETAVTSDIVVKWLIPRDYAEYQRECSSRGIEGTCRWVLESKEYRTWLRSDQQTLFCRGMPGAGKTILTAAVIADLDRQFRDTSNSKVGIAYIYFHYHGQPSDQKVDLLVKNLLGQLTRALPDTMDALDYFNHARKFYDKHGASDSVQSPSLNDILDVFCRVAAWYKDIFIVIDALDECRNPTWCVEFLDKITSLRSKDKVKVKVNLRIFLTLRISREAQGLRNRDFLTLDIRAKEEDIRKYLDKMVPELRDVVRHNPSLKEEVKTEIITKVDGVFLLAKLYMERLKGLSTETDVRKQLQSFKQGKDPSETLALAYGGIFDRIKGQSKELTRLAEKALTWVAFATRTLNETELRYAMAVETGTDKFDEKNLSSAD